MNNIIDSLNKKSVIFKKIEKIDNKSINCKKKLQIFLAVDLKDFYNIIFYKDTKTKILNQEMQNLEGIKEQVEDKIKAKITKKILLTNANICQKAKQKYKNLQWRFLDIM